ncbi:hypothetical protein AB0B81_35480, partial [Streptomyces sp. NPDC039028]
MGPGWDTGRGRATGFPAARRARAVQATGAASRASYSSRAAAISFFGSAVGIAAVTAVYGISGGGLDGVRAALVVPLAMVALGAVVTACTGIGYRGMSTSLAAALTVPVDDLAEIVAARL